jgi:hypothetical protein
MNELEKTTDVLGVIPIVVQKQENICYGNIIMFKVTHLIPKLFELNQTT